MIDRQKKRDDMPARPVKDNVSHTVKSVRMKSRHEEIDNMIERANAEMNRSGPEWKA